MIRTIEEFVVVRKQLSLVEDALAALRCEVLPKHRRNFEILAEGYIEQIGRLREETDAYLGIVISKVTPTGNEPHQADNQSELGQDSITVQA